jgi:hypothetical protein
MKKLSFVKFSAIQIAGVSLLSGCITINPPSPSPSESETSFQNQVTSPADSSSTAEYSDEDEDSTGQAIDYTISGGCQESFDEVGYYGMMESLNDDCTLIVQVLPEAPQRTVELQFFEDGWVTENTATTDSEGFAYLDVDPYCDDDLWCEGLWEFRILVNARDDLPSDTSITFEIEFFPY